MLVEPTELYNMLTKVTTISLRFIEKAYNIFPHTGGKGASHFGPNIFGPLRYS